MTPDDGFASFLLLQDALKHPWICINVPAVPLDLSQVGVAGIGGGSVTSTLMTFMILYDSMMGCFEGSLGTGFFHYLYIYIYIGCVCVNELLMVYGPYGYLIAFVTVYDFCAGHVFMSSWITPATCQS